MNDNNTTTNTETVGKKKPGRPPLYDRAEFVRVFSEVHAQGGDIQMVADRLGMTKQKVNSLAGQLRTKGEQLPKFRRGRRPGQKNMPNPAEVQASESDFTPESTSL